MSLEGDFDEYKWEESVKILGLETFYLGIRKFRISSYCALILAFGILGIGLFSSFIVLIFEKILSSLF